MRRAAQGQPVAKGVPVWYAADQRGRAVQRVEVVKAKTWWLGARRACLGKVVVWLVRCGNGPVVA